MTLNLRQPTQGLIQGGDWGDRPS